jgi:hypothetical protein
MLRTATALSLLLSAALPSAAAADDLKPLEAGTFLLGMHTASIYYTVEGASYAVVTTIAPASDAPGAPVRFTASLFPGQKQTIAVGAFATTAAPAVLEVVRTGDTLSAGILPPQEELASH